MPSSVGEPIHYHWGYPMRLQTSWWQQREEKVQWLFKVCPKPKSGSLNQVAVSLKQEWYRYPCGNYLDWGSMIYATAVTWSYEKYVHLIFTSGFENRNWNSGEIVIGVLGFIPEACSFRLSRRHSAWEIWKTWKNKKDFTSL